MKQITNNFSFLLPSSRKISTKINCVRDLSREWEFMRRRISGRSENVAVRVPCLKYMFCLWLVWLCFREYNARGTGPQDLNICKFAVTGGDIDRGWKDRGTRSNLVTRLCAVKRSHSCPFIPAEYSTISLNLYSCRVITNFRSICCDA